MLSIIHFFLWISILTRQTMQALISCDITSWSSLFYKVQWRSLASCSRQRTDCTRLPAKAARALLSQPDTWGLRKLPTISVLFLSQWNASKFIAVSLEWMRYSRGIKSTNQIFVGICAGECYPLPFPLPIKDGNQFFLIKYSRIHNFCPFKP